MKRAVIITIAAFEIFLAVSLSFYISGQYAGYENIGISRKNSSFPDIYEKLLYGIWGGNLVSAQEQELWTCAESKDGSICQEYLSGVCEGQCSSDCFPGRRQDFFECRLGTCIDKEEGTCAPNSPKALCENQGGEWDERFVADIPECRPGCCLLGGGAQYATESACNSLISKTGLEGEFRIVENEIQCLALSDEQAEGACVLEEVPGTNGKRNCKFGTQSECTILRGEFNPGVLCSAEELETVCEQQERTGCFENEDEVFWFDSCGNRENIYDSNKARSHNSGKTLSKAESCSLGSGNDDFGNQESCGNCNYLLGSVCGSADANDEAPIYGNFACNSLECIDEWGNERKNGESWCAFQGTIGEDKENPNQKINTDVPGTRHFRRSCIDGEVRTEACADFRNEICSESRDENIDFSTASCRINNWQQCLEANTNERKIEKCEDRTDCTLHNVEIDDNFKFSMCTPKYPPGFDLGSDSEGFTAGGEIAEEICSAASTTCKYIEVKRLFGGWKCEANCACKEAKFTETLNNLCVSLGDCGAHVNIEGEFTEDGVSGNNRLKALTDPYIKSLQSYVGAKQGQVANPLSDREITAFLGLNPENPEQGADSGEEILGRVGVGASGVIALAGFLTAVKTAGGITAAFEAAGGSFFGVIVDGITQMTTASSSVIHSLPATDIEGELLVPTSLQTTQFGAFVNYASAAAAGAAIGFFVGKAFGFEGEALLVTSLVTAISAVILAQPGTLNTFLEFFGFGGAEGAGLFSPQFFIAVIVIALFSAALFKLLGIGKTRTRQVVFECLPWQPPQGGSDCSQCGKDGLGCSEYQCQSLGQNCELINKGTTQEQCVNTNPNDITPPVIRENQGVKEEGFEYSDVSERGFKIQRTGGDGCIPGFTNVNFGIETSEPAQCKISKIRGVGFEDSLEFFGASNLYKTEHFMNLNLPSLSSLGETGIDPESRADFDIFVKCSDSSGNANPQDYVINFCVSPEKDITAPKIKSFNPESPGFSSFNGTEKLVRFFMNEPAECRWDFEDKEYSLMENDIACDTEIDNSNIFGWECATTLPVNSEENKYNIRCLDQPWIEEETPGKKRNPNLESFSYVIKRSLSELKIIDLEPKGTVESVGIPVVLNLKAKTEGGVEEFATYCEFDFGTGFVRFLKSGGKEHEQPNLRLFRTGDYSVPVRCEDEAGNIAIENAEFRVEVDSSGPIITRVYQQQPELKVITNEPAECFYSLNSCNFDLDSKEANQMTGSDFIHDTDFDPKSEYHIKCKDEFENIGACFVVRQGFS